MAIGTGNRRTRGALKKSLGISGEDDKVLTGTGQNIEQDSPIVSNKALEQQLVRGGARRKGRSTLRRPEEEPFTDPASQLTAGERFRLDAPKTEATVKRVAKGQGPLQPVGGARARTGGAINPRTGERFTEKFGTSFGGVSKEGVLTLVGPGEKAPAGARKPAGTGLDFDILDFEGLDNIFSSAGNLAAFFSSPAFQSQQFKARGAQSRRKIATAQTKATNERIKALSSALENIPDIEGNEDIRGQLTSQITDLITNGSEQDDPVFRFAELAKNRGFKREEIESLAQRLFGGENA
jgi:hypothetical protein